MNSSAREETVIKEVLVLARPYSLLRCAGMKWTTEGEEGKMCEQVKTEDGAVVTLFLTQAGNPLFQICRSDTPVQEYYSLPDLTQRLILKRNPDLFRNLYTVWRFINPTRGKAISKEVYLRLTETFAASLSLPFSTHFSLHDMHLDFKHLQTLLFKDFYDSFFQLLDCSLASKTPAHYVKQAATACSGLLNARWYRQLAVGKAEESRDRRRAFEGWMLPFFKYTSRSAVGGSLPTSPVRAGSCYREEKKEREMAKVNIEVKMMVRPKRKASSTVRSRPSSNPASRPHLSAISTDYSLLRIHSMCPSPRPLPL